MPATQPNDREHGQKDAEQRLVESALTLFSENGYDGTSIRAIIERARVTRPVLYYYFKNKEDLFFRLAHSSFAEFNSFLDEMTARVSGCRERLKTLLRWVFEQTERSPEMVRLILHAFFSGSEENLRPRMRAMAEGRFARIVGIMRDGLESGELGGGDPEVLALVFSGIMDMHSMARAHMEEGRLTVELADALVDVFMDGAQCPAPSVKEVKSPFAGTRLDRPVARPGTRLDRPVARPGCDGKTARSKLEFSEE